MNRRLEGWTMQGSTVSAPPTRRDMDLKNANGGAPERQGHGLKIGPVGVVTSSAALLNLARASIFSAIIPPNEMPVTSNVWTENTQLHNEKPPRLSISCKALPARCVWVVSHPICRRSSNASRASCRVVYGGRVASLRPTPRLSKVTI